MKQVRFNKLVMYNTFHRQNQYSYPKNNEQWLKNKSYNRRLRKIERYMRKNYLLERYEFLELNNYETRHIRNPFINLISQEKRWINYDDYLNIIT